MSFNSITVQGNLGRDPETKILPDGQALTSFSIATSRKIKGKDSTTWFRCVCFGKTAEIAGMYLKKGSNALVQGSINSREYTNKDGVKQTAWEVTVNQLVLLNSKAESDSLASDSGTTSPQPNPDGLNVNKAKPAAAAKPKSFDDYDDDIPF